MVIVMSNETNEAPAGSWQARRMKAEQFWKEE
jgi:hypothetical protein